MHTDRYRILAAAKARCQRLMYRLVSKSLSEEFQLWPEPAAPAHSIVTTPSTRPCNCSGNTATTRHPFHC
ncbi:hypothetical protein EMIT0232MI5_10031 [Pseudomonas sp. IT-232MI5]